MEGGAGAAKFSGHGAGRGAGAAALRRGELDEAEEALEQSQRESGDRARSGAHHPAR